MPRNNPFNSSAIGKRILFLFAAVILLSSNMPAQQINSYHKSADAKFDKGQYEQAGKLYFKALAVDEKNDSIVAPFIPFGHKHKPKKADSNPAYLTYQLAECFRKVGNNINAQKMYEKFFTFNQEKNFPLARFWYAQCLKNNNEPQQAITEFNKFITKHKENDSYTQSAKTQLIECNGMIQLLNAKNKTVVTKMPAPINDPNISFALQRMNDSVFIFTSAKPDTLKRKVEYPLFVYWGNFNNKTVIHKTVVKDNSHEMAAACLSPNELTLYFTSWKTKKINAIYYTTRKDLQSQWEAPIEMAEPVNEKKYSSKHPFMTGDGKYLLFASDRPGGSGGFDIWYVTLKDGKITGDAKNVGVHTNSVDEDITPFYDTARNTLYFSSVRKGGKGGMDIYSSKGSLATNQWKSAVSLPYPINTASDDLFYRHYANTDTAYLSSNRKNPDILEIYSVVDVTETVVVETTKDTVPTPPVYVNKPVVVTPPVIKNTEADKRKHIIDSLNALTQERFNTHFDLNSSDIREEDKSVLDRKIQMLNQNPDLNIVVASFTDCKGNARANRRVARARARAIRRYLIRNGISSSRINIDFFAAEHYVLPCKDDNTYNEAEQIVNRRADILLTKEKNPKWKPSGKETDVENILKSFTDKEHSTNERTERVTERRNKKLGKSASKAKEKTDKKVSQLNSKAKVTKVTNEVTTGNIIKVDEKELAKNLAVLESSLNNKNIQIDSMLRRSSRQPIFLYTLSDSVRIDLYDNGLFDYDSISVIYNKQLMVKKQLLQVGKPISFMVKVDNDQSKNLMIFYAENLGKEPPNSALMVITDGEGKRTEIGVSSDLQHNAIIYFIKARRSQ